MNAKLFCHTLVIACLSLPAFSGWAQTGEFTVQVGSTPPPPVQLVVATDNWHYRKGTNEPPADWHSVADGSLDGTWNVGPGGIGVGDGDDGTVLNDMVGNYVTVYMRQSFNVASALDTNLHLRLVMDWDDGFIAYLDGVEVARSFNVPGTPGTVHPYNQDLASTGNQDHPASVDGGAVETFDLGPIGDRLAPGDHVLAIQGINGDVGSSDVSLIPDLFVVDLGGGVSLANGLFSLVTSDFVALSGTNTIPEAARVFVNGAQASFNLARGTWTRTESLTPGMNRFYIATVDLEGNVLASINQDVVYQQSTVQTGGLLAADAVWDPSMGTIRVVSDLTVAAGVELTLEPGTVVLLSSGISMFAQTNGVIHAQGTEADPVFLLPADGTTPWGEISAEGSGATLTLQQAEVVAGQVRILRDAVVTVEDSVMRDMYVRQMLEGEFGAQLTLRRTHWNRYSQTHIDFTPTLIEDCLFENIDSDATDFEGGNFNVTIRRTTYRHGFGGNTDAFDTDNSLGIVVEDSLFRNFPDKAISIADNSHDTVIRNNLILDCGSGISVYASSNCVFNQNTVVNSGYGLWLYVRPGRPSPGNEVPGSGTATNNILWGSLTNLSLTDGAMLQFHHGNVEGPTAPTGTGNLNIDPLFLDPVGLDYRLAPGSPSLGSGAGGTDMGVIYPVGGIPASPKDLVARGISDSEILVAWTEDADNESEILVERSLQGLNWSVRATLPPNTSSYVDSGLESQDGWQYRARAVNTSGTSRPSNAVRAESLAFPVSQTTVGGTLPGNTTWTTNQGRIMVNADVVIPDGVTLTMEPGILVEMGPGTSIRTAPGGIINILGSANQRVVIRSAFPGNDWDDLSATGTGSSLAIRHADISGGRILGGAGMTGLVEDSLIHDSSASAIILTTDAQSFVLRRTWVFDYGETLFQRTLMTIEDCLFERPRGDAVDFDGPPRGSVIRQSTFRNGPSSNTDAVDIGPSRPVAVPVGVLIEDCLMHDFSDKGVSIGEIELNFSEEIIVRNCLMYNLGRGVQVKDTTIATIYNCTIVDSEIGIHGFEKNAAANPGGGILTNYNNILFNNLSAITIEPPPLTIIEVNYCNTWGIDWPGIGNLNADPLFRDAADRDYRLTAGSPSIGTGLGGVDMGITYPIGGHPVAPVNLQAQANSGRIDLAWAHNGLKASGFQIQISTNALSWLTLTNAPGDANSLEVTGLLNGFPYFFRVQATNFTGQSLSSNVASLGGDPNDLDGDGLPNDWETDNGLNPNDPSDALADTDEDGSTNLHEYQSGTDPQDPNSYFGFISIHITDEGVVELSFLAQANRTYSVEFRNSLDDGIWQDLMVDVPLDNSTRIFVVRDILLPIFKSRYYRLVTP